MSFPDIKIKTLSGQKLNIPSDLKGQNTLIILVFEEGGKYEEPQAQAKKWIELYNSQLQDSNINLLEIAMMSGKYRLMSFVIDSGMKSGIPPELHDQVASFYGDKKKVMKDLNIYDLRRAYVYLLDQNGQVKYKTSGTPNENSAEELVLAISKV
ncbi:hypothetical protein [Jiulongibacter sp. NS-SX5]|uniref:hypothetical protein n=1 Tax=Jiulongibacter sp. NS-SX5 TaxID=3463854 RepID=UPI004058F0E3